MPCLDGREDSNRQYIDKYEMRSLQNKVKKLEAMLCAVISCDPTVISEINPRESGITVNDLQKWWINHTGVFFRKEQDRKRRLAERARKADFMKKEEEKFIRLAKKLGYNFSPKF